MMCEPVHGLLVPWTVRTMDCSPHGMKRRSAVGPLLAAIAVPASAAGNGTTPAWPPARRRVGDAGPLPANRHRASIPF